MPTWLKAVLAVAGVVIAAKIVIALVTAVFSSLFFVALVVGGAGGGVGDGHETALRVVAQFHTISVRFFDISKVAHVTCIEELGASFFNKLVKVVLDATPREEIERVIRVLP